jgi:hypothetical protein
MSKRQQRTRGKDGPYTALPKAITGAPAWRTMSFGARLLYIALRGWLRNDRLNNGKQFLSCRDAAEEIGATRSMVAVWYAENVHYGFLCKTGEGFLGGDGHGIAATYRFTDLPHGTHPPTRDYKKWDGEVFAYTPRKTTTKKQKPVPKIGTPRPENRDIRSTMSQVRAIEILLRKSVPDLTKTEVPADATHRYVAQLPEVLSKEEWLAKYGAGKITLQ